MDGAAEAGVGTLAVLPWASRIIFLGFEEGNFLTPGPKTRTQDPASYVCCPAPPFSIDDPYPQKAAPGLLYFESRLDHLGDDLQADPLPTRKMVESRSQILSHCIVGSPLD